MPNDKGIVKQDTVFPKESLGLRKATDIAVTPSSGVGPVDGEEHPNVPLER